MSANTSAGGREASMVWAQLVNCSVTAWACRSYVASRVATAASSSSARRSSLPATSSGGGRCCRW